MFGNVPEDVRLIWPGADEFSVLSESGAVYGFVSAEKGCCLVTDRAVGDVLEGYTAAAREAA